MQTLTANQSSYKLKKHEWQVIVVTYKTIEELEKSLEELEEIRDFWQELSDNAISPGFFYTPGEPTQEEVFIKETEAKIRKVKNSIQEKRRNL